jgi:hypothetical protein
MKIGDLHCDFCSRIDFRTPLDFWSGRTVVYGENEKHPLWPDP